MWYVYEIDPDYPALRTCLGRGETPETAYAEAVLISNRLGFLGTSEQLKSNPASFVCVFEENDDR